MTVVTFERPGLQSVCVTVVKFEFPTVQSVWLSSNLNLQGAKVCDCRHIWASNGQKCVTVAKFSEDCGMKKMVQKGPAQKLAKKCHETSFPQEKFKLIFLAPQNQIFYEFEMGAPMVKSA